MTLDSYMYRDPEEVLIRKQEEAMRKERACGQCIHKRSVEFKSEVVHLCEFKRHVYGRRCDLFEIKKGTL